MDFDVNNVERRELVIFYSYVAVYKSYYNYCNHELENKRTAVGFCGLHIQFWTITNTTRELLMVSGYCLFRTAMKTPTKRFVVVTVQHR